jgi:pSer/pThr/pTyr-binding forkhead associated (FHA) protein
MSLAPNGELVPQGGGDSIPLEREMLLVGRRDSCDIRLPFPNISGMHCELKFSEGYWTIRDLNSTNGIKVNSERVLKKLLHPGDEVMIGKRKFTIQYEMPAGRRAMEEVEEDIMSQSLLERAGLEKPRQRKEEERPAPAKDGRPSENGPAPGSVKEGKRPIKPVDFDPADILLADE